MEQNWIHEDPNTVDLDQSQQDQSQENQNQQNQNSNSGTGDTGIPAWLVAVNQASNERAEAERKAAELQRKLDEFQRNQQQPAQPILQEGELYTNPDKFLGILRQEMQQSVAPVNQWMQQQQRQQAYTDLKNRVKGLYPHQAAAFAQIEPLVDTIMHGQEPTEQNLQIAIQRAVGQIQLNGGFQNQQQPNQNQNQNQQQQSNQNQNDMTIPPHLRPSARPTNQRQDAPQRVELTENERRLARENGYTPEEFVRMRDATPYEVEAVYKDILAKRKAAAGGAK